MLHGNFFTEKTGDNDIRVKMFQKAKELDPNALRFVNDYNVLIALWNWWVSEQLF